MSKRQDRNEPFGSRIKCRLRRGARRGAALLEAMVGGAMLAIGLAVLISLNSNALARQQLGEHRIVVAALLDELLNLVLAEGPVDFPKKHDTAGTFAPPFEEYGYTIEIVDQGDIEPFLVTATIRWFANGYWRQASVRTMISLPRTDGEPEIREPGEPIAR